MVVVAFALVVVVVSFVGVAMLCDASGSNKVLLLAVLAKPELGAEVKLAIRVVVRNIKIAKLNF